VLPPGSTIGILGGGQLGRMTAIAAAQLGYRVHVFCPEKDPPAAQVANQLITANYSDQAALDTFASQVKHSLFS
jgi:phosphoribosylaminoimidazole carboxylase (NCAIR synthetase)